MQAAKNNSVPTTILGYALKAEPKAFAFIKPGDLVEGKVLRKSARLILIDLGKYGTGAVYYHEIQNAREVVRGMEIGGPAQGKVVDVNNEDGYVELSISEAGRQRAWMEIGELKEKDEPFEVTVLSANKGGLTAEVAGLAAFLPASQLFGEHAPKSLDDRAVLADSLTKLVGQKLMVKIMDANPRMNKLIISEREANEISMRDLVKNYKISQVVDGIVSSVADFGAFVRFADNPQVEGLIHVSELDWKMVENPKEVVRVDDTIKAKIIDIKDGKISLSLKALKEDPWANLPYKEGQAVSGSVYSLNPFGAVINVGDVQGQLHVTDFGGVEEMKKALQGSKEHSFVVESLKPEERRMVLKLKK